MTSTNQVDDFLVEIHTEELPPKALLKLAQAFCEQIKERLNKLALPYTEIHYFATPRRLAVLVTQLAAFQPSQIIERRGPAKNAAFDATGNPTPALIGFAKSCGVTPAELITIHNAQGEWLGFKQQVAGKSVPELLPSVIEQALAALPIPKRMRWGAGDAQFVRPVHAIILLYGSEVVPAEILGVKTDRITRGHRFMSSGWITIPHANQYETLLEEKGCVIVDFNKRRELIRRAASACLIEKNAQVFISSDELLNEVTGLVEWPVALSGEFAETFLNLPQEVLISAMQDHQRYFPVVDTKQKLLPRFVTISNLDSREPQYVVHGNERVLRARLADAAFFYTADQQETLAQRVDHLKHIVFQAKLGTLYDKAERISKLTAFIAEKMQIDPLLAARAGMLAKTDLTTNMVNEFPELQGVMGYYYAQAAGETTEVAVAIKEQYMPRFAGDALPNQAFGQALACADRIDTLLGAFGIMQIPTGDKDPYGLRRAALGVLRILIEKNINLDLQTVLAFALANYTIKLENPDVVAQVLHFMQERLRAWYQEQQVDADVFAAVAALQISNPLDVHERIKAVQEFKKLTAAEALSVANKRVSNILAKYEEALTATTIQPEFFETASEKELAAQLDAKSATVAALSQAGHYHKILLQLAELREPVDDFFAQVMVMTDNKSQRENRILLLRKLRGLFLHVADIALLQ